MRKIPTRLRGMNFCTSSARFAQVRKATKQFRMHPISTKCTKMSVHCPTGRIGCVRCEKFRRDIVARTFALVRPVLLRVSKGNQTVPNAPKQYETHQNFRLGSNWVDRMRSLPKCTQTERNAAKRQFSVQRGGSGAFVATNSDATSWHELLH